MLGWLQTIMIGLMKSVFGMDPMSGGTPAFLPSSYLDTDGTLAANSDVKIATQKAVKTYADQLIASADAMIFKGVIDCSANPNYPAADRGHTYRVSVAGKIGGASGVNVENGDLLMCMTDGSASGTQAAVGANWAIAQTNIDGALVSGGPLGTPSSGVGTNLTGTAAGLTAGTASAVAVGGITGLGSGVATALAANVGSAGAPVVFNGAGGTPSSINLASATFPTLNQNTTGSAASLSVSGQTGLLTVTGITSSNRAKTVRDAADTLLELGGSYTPSGTWTNMPLTTPAITGLPTGSGVSSAATASTLTARDANANESANSFKPGYATAATANVTTTLTVASAQTQYFTGSVSGQIIQMPVTSTLSLGQYYDFYNGSTATITITSSGGNTIVSPPTGINVRLTCILTTGTDNGSWAFEFSGANARTGSTNLVYSLSPTLTTPRIVTQISDANANELIRITATASAVNDITVTNAATGNAPSITATGDDGAVSLIISAKGTTGVLIFKGIASRTVSIAQFQTSAGGSLGNVSGGCIGDVIANVSTTSTDGTFNTLRTDTLVANALIANGDKVYFDYTCTIATHTTNTADFKLAFAGITVWDSGALTFAAAGRVRIFGYITRVTSTTALATITFDAAGSTTIVGYSDVVTVPPATLTGLTLTGTNNLVLSAAAAGTGAASGDIALVHGTWHLDSFGS